MKTVATILSAALIAGTSTVAMAQGAGGDSNPNKVGRGTDANPTTPGASPELGNSAAPPADRIGEGAESPRGGMMERNVSGTPATPRNSNSSNPTQAPSPR